MKPIYLLLCLLILAIPGFSQTKISENMRKLGSWQDSTTTTRYNEIWGYAANGREYAIIGGLDATYFIDVTDPQNPELVQKVDGPKSYRDYKTYSHYAYEVMTGGFGLLPTTSRIYDLQYLPDSVHVVYDGNQISRNAHTLFINNQKLYLVNNYRNSGGSIINNNLDVFSLSNPALPTYIGSFNPSFGDKLHAIFVKNDTAFCSFSNAGLFIYNLADLSNPLLIGSITTYPGKGYNHSSWVTSDSKKLVFTDELPNGLPIKLYDISDPVDPLFLSTFSNNSPATPHNCFIVDDKYVFVSNYLDGVQVFDITNPKQVKRIGFYDTYPDNGPNYPQNQMDHLEGNWGVYPFLPSGNTLASDMTHGLFLLKMEEIPLEPKPQPTKPTITGNITIFPNPGSNSLSFALKEPASNFNLTIFDTIGRKVKNVSFAVVQESKVDIANLAAGLYLVHVSSDGFTETHRFLIRK